MKITPRYVCAWEIQAQRSKINFTFRLCSQIVTTKERWQSGRSCLTRNQVAGQPARGFESLPLRHFNCGLRIYDCRLYGVATSRRQGYTRQAKGTRDHRLECCLVTARHNPQSQIDNRDAGLAGI